MRARTHAVSSESKSSRTRSRLPSLSPAGAQVLLGCSRWTRRATGRAARRAVYSPTQIASKLVRTPRTPRTCSVLTASSTVTASAARQRTGLEWDAEASARPRPRLPSRFLGRHPCRRRRAEGAWGGTGARAGRAQRSWSPSGLAAPPRRVRRPQIYKGNKRLCDRIFGWEIFSRSSCSTPLSFIS